MKVMLFLCCIAMFVSCTQGPKHDPSKPPQLKKAQSSPKIQHFKKFALPDDFRVIDTGKYADELEGGTYFIISNNRFTDTINCYFGFNKLGKYYVYQKLRIGADSLWNGKIMYASHGTYTLLDQEYKRQPLSNVAENVHDYFSAPAVINDKLYFWQLIKQDTAAAEFDIHAAEFDPATLKTTSYFMYKDDVGTDWSGYFAPPVLENNLILFGDERTWKFTKDFKPIP